MTSSSFSSSSSLPSSRYYITHLLSALPTLAYSSVNAGNPEPSAAAPDGVSIAPPNPLTSAPEQAKKQLLALQVVFPNEFLPALDLLDRRLVTRFQIHRQSGSESNKERRKRDAVDDNPISAAAEYREPGKGNNLDVWQAGEEAGAEATEPSHADGGLENPLSSPIQRTQRSSLAVDATNNALAQGTIVALLPSQVVPLLDAPLDDPEEGEQQRAQQNSTTVTEPFPTGNKDAIYYVRSAQQHSSRYATSYDATTCYEVRLHAWNCSCPAFAFAAFPLVHPEPPVQTYNPHEVPSRNAETAEGEQNNEWIFGGVSLGEGIPPVCKHLLACILIEHCGALFGGFVEERDVGVEEAAGWAAGWGD